MAEVATQAQTSFGEAVADSIGTRGERLTRSEAFDLVRRSVEALVQGEDATSASAARQKAFELLGRDSESLSARNFERILQDAHDANMIDLRRRGNDFELARAVDAAPIVDQLKAVEQAQQAAAALNAPPAAPRGMGARGVGGRGMGGRGKGLGGPPPELLMVGVVGRPAGSVPVGAVSSNRAPVTPATMAAPAVVAPAAEVAVTAPLAAPVVTVQPVDVVETVDSKRAKASASKSAAAKTPAKKAAKAPAKVPAKPVAKPAAKTPVKAPDTAPDTAPAKAPAKAAKTPAKKVAKAPAKKAAKTGK